MQESEELATTVNRIRRSLNRAGNEFALFFVLVNLAATRKEVVRLLKAGLTRPVQEIFVRPDRLENTTLDSWLKAELEDVSPQAVILLHDLDLILPTDKQGLIQALQQLNWRRSALSRIGRPLVIFLPAYALDRMAEYAPDLYDWYSNVYEIAAPAQDVEQIRKGFQSEFAGEVHAADRLSWEEKEEWLHTLTALLAEQSERNGHRAKLLNDLGRLYFTMGRLDDALEAYEQSLKIRQEIGNKSGEGTSLNNISQIYDSRGDFDTALSYLKESLKIRQEIGDAAGLCATLFNIGHIHAQNQEINEAVQAWITVYHLAKKINLAQALQALEQLAPQLGMENGLDSWQDLADRMSAEP